MNNSHPSEIADLDFRDNRWVTYLFSPDGKSHMQFRYDHVEYVDTVNPNFSMDWHRRVLIIYKSANTNSITVPCTIAGLQDNEYTIHREDSHTEYPAAIARSIWNWLHQNGWIPEKGWHKEL